LKRVSQPDKKIVQEICALFECHADFEAWTEDTVRRGLGRLAKSDGYALYRSDAQTFAEGIRVSRAAERAEHARHDAKCRGVECSITRDTFQGETLTVIVGTSCSTCGKRRGIGKEQVADAERKVAERLNTTDRDKLIWDTTRAVAKTDASLLPSVVSRKYVNKAWRSCPG
jgi:hypothetical protein